MSRRVLVVGGTGSFGARLVEGLVATTDLDVIIAARNVERAEALKAVLRARHPDRQIEAHGFDATTATADDLRRASVWCAVDAAGPFQTRKLVLVEAAIAARCHYVDLADGRDFVAAIDAFDEAARVANVLIVSGASSTPALSNAVLDQLTKAWRRIDRIEVAISPGNRQPRGLSVIKAILTNAGQPIRVFRDGAWTRSRGMAMLVHRRMPGLGRRWLFLFDTPDLDLITKRFAPRCAALFRAGLELAIPHLALWALSKLVVIRLLPNLVPLARPLRTIAEWLRPRGSSRGGMSVSVEGVNRDGRAGTATWALIAEEDGPNVPILPALALIRSLADGRMSQRGAMPCVGLLTLADIAQEFNRFHIVTRRKFTPRSLFARVLGSKFGTVPDAIQNTHRVDDVLVLEGRASIDGAKTLLARAIARLIGFPSDGRDVPVSVTMRAVDGGEEWTRVFGRARFRTQLTRLDGFPNRIIERFGLCTFNLRLTARPEGLDYTVISGRIGFVPLPTFLIPRSAATERVDDAGRFQFDVPIALPGLGLLVRYRGWLTRSGKHCRVDSGAALVRRPRWKTTSRR
jgi:NAD(P)-dependent dehydrogenase (short-subunit alcohol dehydrogenase family)